MSEVDRLSNSGLYPALPIGDKRRPKDRPGEQPGSDRSKSKGDPAATPDSISESGTYRIPKSLIDDYA